MSIRGYLAVALLFFSTTASLLAEKVGLCIVATGKYDVFVDPLIATARQYFCPDHEVTYFVFADGDRISKADDVVQIYQERLGWPYDTMMRNSIYDKHKEVLAGQDYLFAVDADMRFVDVVGSEILGERVATIHPGYIGRRGTYETNPASLAYVEAYEGQYYFAGGFFGGAREEFFHIISETTGRILDDLEHGIIAIWHDESHWNRYCIDFEPTVMLNPSYCYPESWQLDFPKKLLCLDKDHAEFRS